jgi:hypothetical protein
MSVLDDLDAPLQSALRSAERATDAYIRTLVDSAWRDLTPHFQESRLHIDLYRSAAAYADARCEPK